jgi:2,3-bisphosphoglycerate-independent phosphoglycerate mutase
VLPGEDRVLAPSPEGGDLRPGRDGAAGVADALIASVSQKKHDVIICNFANPDRSATLAAWGGDRAVKADGCLARDPGDPAAGAAIVTADHGNCEQMRDTRRTRPTPHTTNLVPTSSCRAWRANPLTLPAGAVRRSPTLLGSACRRPRR